MSITELRHARERLGLSLRDVADRTRIRVAILDAIENHDVDRLPPPIFTSGFVKAYAREVGLDPQVTAARYAAALEPAGPSSDVAAPVRHGVVGDSDSLTERERSSLVTAALIVGAGLVFVLVNPWKSSLPSHDNTVASAAIAIAAAGPVAREAVATTGEARPIVPAGPRTPNMRIELAPRSACWIEATADGDRIIYKLLDTGDRYAIEGYENLVLKVGDPSALVYSINGARGRPLGAAGQATTVHLTRENSRAFAVGS